MSTASTPAFSRRSMSSLVEMPLSATNIMSEGTCCLSIRQVLMSTEKSLRSRLFTPMTRAPALIAMSISDAVRVSTNAVIPRPWAIFTNLLRSSSFSNAQISSTAEAPRVLAS